MEIKEFWKELKISALKEAKKYEETKIKVKELNTKNNKKIDFSYKENMRKK